MGLILICWVGPKVHGFGPIGWVRSKVNGLYLSLMGLNFIGLY